jgi:hypothetical protein
MLRIVLSRAALLPWLGILLMAVGAGLPPEGNAGWIVVAVGANVAFYSLLDFRDNFEWSEAARPMLALCGVLFVIGLALLALATLPEALNRWLALLCIGGYLCMFAVWMVQNLVGMWFRVLAVAGSLLMILGGIVGLIAWDEWQLAAESAETPQDITLADLKRNGFGTNRYIRLKEFRFCEKFVADDRGGKAKVHDQWYPVLPLDGQTVTKDGPPPPVPPRVEVVAAYISLGNAAKRPGAPNVRDVLMAAREAQGHECTVVTGIKTLKPEVQKQLLELAPQTDFAEVLVLQLGKPASADRVRAVLIGSGAALVTGWLCLVVVYLRAWKEMRAAGWTDPDATPEAAAGAEQPPIP